MSSLILLLHDNAGGQITQDFSKANTFLILTEAAGKKYEAAVKWGVPAVSLFFNVLSGVV